MDLTRRGLVARGATAAGALMAGSALAPRLAFAGSDGEAVWEMRIPRSATARHGWLSGQIEAKREFELIGIELPGSANAVELRARGLDRGWSEWLPLHAGHGHAPDDGPATAETTRRALSDPVWVGPATAFELRAPRSLQGAKALLVHAGRPARAAAAKRFVDSGLAAGAGQPPIIARSSWATASCRPRVPAAFGTVDLGFVHHTVSTNGYRPSQSAAMIRSICLFHKYGNGWDDIGYNFVVDRYGQIFEARAGGIDEAIVGAHAGGYNAYSSGAALLGTFTAAGPPKRTFDALARLLAWKLSLHGLRVPGSVTVQVTRDGSPYSRYRAGARVTLNRIAGHRDADATSCPGAAAYRQLPRLRQVVARLTPNVSALTLQLLGAVPGSATVGGTLMNDDVPLAAATVEIQLHSTTAAPATLATVQTAGDGTWSAGLALPTTAQLRAIFRGDAAHAAAVSPGILAPIPPQLTLGASAAQTAPGGVIQFTGTIAPVKPKLTLVIAQQQPDGSYAPVRSIRLAPAQDGSFSRAVGFPAAGQYQVVAHSPADARNALGTSAAVAITVA